jgi:hypothetical protein
MSPKVIFSVVCGLTAAGAILFVVLRLAETPLKDDAKANSQKNLAQEIVKSKQQVSYDPADPAQIFRNEVQQITWQIFYDAQAPKKGDMAPEIELADQNGQNTFRLSDYREKLPVALVFGSLTCPMHTGSAESLNQLQKDFGGEVKIVQIYLREAHAFEMTSEKFNILHDPKTIEQRRVMANECRSTMQPEFETYVDNLDDGTMRAYAAFPTRLYLVGRDGRIAYQGGLGPKDYDVAELRAAVIKELQNIH